MIIEIEGYKVKVHNDKYIVMSGPAKGEMFDSVYDMVAVLSDYADARNKRADLAARSALNTTIFIMIMIGFLALTSVFLS